MTVSERQRLGELVCDESASADDLMLLFERATPAKRAEMREYLAGWTAAMKRFGELREQAEIDRYLRTLDGR